MNWPTTILLLGVLVVVLIVSIAVVTTRLEARKLDLDEARADEVRRLVGRYEDLATSTLDAQTRAAADLAELHARVAGVERILRTVE